MMGKGKKENSQSLAAKFEFYSCSRVDLCASPYMVKHALGLTSGRAEIQFAETAGHVVSKKKTKKKKEIKVPPRRESSNWIPCVKIISVVIIQVFLFVIIIVVSIQQLDI